MISLENIKIHENHSDYPFEFYIEICALENKFSKLKVEENIHKFDLRRGRLSHKIIVHLL